MKILENVVYLLNTITLAGYDIYFTNMLDLVINRTYLTIELLIIIHQYVKYLFLKIENFLIGFDC